MPLTNLLDYLERTAARLPDKPAFVGEDCQFTFQQVRDAARRLGCALAQLSPRRNGPVAVFVDRTPANLVAFQGVLYAGHYYVPLDKQMPLARMRSILETLQPVALVYSAGEEETAQALSDFCPLLKDTAGFSHPLQEEVLAQRRAGVLDTDPAYILFTSGSTGVPKGIVASHHSILDFCEWIAQAEEITEEDVFGNQAPFYFDASVKDLYPALRCGATLVVLPKKSFSFPLVLVEQMDAWGVTVLNWAASAFHLLANSGVLEKRAPATLRLVATGGESLRAKQLNRWRAALPQVRYINMYGPTEIGVDCTWYPIQREFADDEPIPIGRACANMEVFLLDQEMRPVPPGQAGELCVRGSGLAQGYFGQWDKTQAAFIQDPRNPYYPDRIYRTGDLAVMDEEGVFTFLTRQDGQIKHMGYRIELGEIETVLSSVPALEEIACLFDGEKDRIHCVYTGGEDPKALAKTARALLPRYMVPNFYHQLEAMPHNPNGKIDRPKLKEAFIHGTPDGL